MGKASDRQLSFVIFKDYQLWRQNIPLSIYRKDILEALSFLNFEIVEETLADHSL